MRVRPELRNSGARADLRPFISHRQLGQVGLVGGRRRPTQGVVKLASQDVGNQVLKILHARQGEKHCTTDHEYC
jgi:hypothetical protein